MKKRFLSILLTLAMLLSMLPAMGITAFAEETEPERVFPYHNYSCAFKGMTAEQLDENLKAAGYLGLPEGAVEGEDYVTDGDCVWAFKSSNAQVCYWECQTHFGNSKHESEETWQPVRESIGKSHSGTYCPYCKWSDHEHEWDTEHWSFDEYHHWHECTVECYMDDDSQKDGFALHRSGQCVR